MTTKYAEYGEQAAENYIESGVPLNDTIKKIAQDEQLNKHEIERVVERANTKTFLNMFKEADDKTFGFEVAEPELKNIAEDEEEKMANANLTSDYSTPPDSQSESVRETEKQASELDVDGSNESTSIKEHVFSHPERTGRVLTKLSSAEERLEDDLIDLKIRGNEMVDAIKKEAEKLWKDGYSPDDIAAVIKQADVRDSVKKIIAEEVHELAEEKYASIKEWSDHNSIEAERSNVVNPDHKIVKLANDLDNWANKIADKEQELGHVKDMIELANEYKEEY
jgi:hypothetical protein